MTSTSRRTLECTLLRLSLEIVDRLRYQSQLEELSIMVAYESIFVLIHIETS